MSEEPMIFLRIPIRLITSPTQVIHTIPAIWRQRSGWVYPLEWEIPCSHPTKWSHGMKCLHCCTMRSRCLTSCPMAHPTKPFLGFTDASDVASWASEAMALLVENGTVSGSGRTLSPTATTTRAQMAQVLYNLMTK